MMSFRKRNIDTAEAFRSVMHVAGELSATAHALDYFPDAYTTAQLRVILNDMALRLNDYLPALVKDQP